MLWCGVATRYVGSGAFWNGLWCKPRSAAICAWPRTSRYELQSYLQMVSTCAQFGGNWERLSSKLRLAATSARLGQEVHGMPRPDGACLGFVSL